RGPRPLHGRAIPPARPVSRLILMPPPPNPPDGCVGRQDGRAYFNVFVWRLDGFDGPVTLTAEGLPPGVTCPPQVVGPGVRQAGLVFSAGAAAAAWTGASTVKG